MDLYKFPKDILVKMLMTIETDAIKKCEENHIIEIKRMLNSVPNNHNGEFGICNYKDCECYDYYLY